MLNTNKASLRTYCNNEVTTTDQNYLPRSRLPPRPRQLPIIPHRTPCAWLNSQRRGNLRPNEEMRDAKYSRLTRSTHLPPLSSHECSFFETQCFWLWYQLLLRPSQPRDPVFLARQRKLLLFRFAYVSLQTWMCVTSFFFRLTEARRVKSRDFGSYMRKSGLAYFFARAFRDY